jgi:hypothetical protein
MDFNALQCFLTPTAENPWFGLRAMRNRPPTLVVASRQDEKTLWVLFAQS